MLNSAKRSGFAWFWRSGILILWLGWIGNASGQTEAPSSNDMATPPTLVQAVMCENVQGLDPIRSAVVFSIRQGKVFCFTGFDRISTPMPVFHKWYRRDVLITTFTLKLQLDKWSTYSSIGLRESDRGPWRVEVTDGGGNLYAILRFSIVD